MAKSDIPARRYVSGPGPRILFVTYGGGHADIVASLLPALAQLEIPEPTVLALTTAERQLRDMPACVKRCADYLPALGYENALDHGAQLAEEFWAPDSAVSWEETCAYLGVSMVDLCAAEGDDKAQALYDELGRKAFAPVPFLRHVIKVEAPDIVVTTCHVRMERAAILAARQVGISTVRIEDLFGYSVLGIYPYGQKGTLIPVEERPDHLIVMNEAVRDLIVAHGFPEERVQSLGQPVFSDWKDAFLKTAPIAELTGSAEKVLTYVAPPQMSILLEQSQHWVAIAETKPQWLFCIKLHPSVGREQFLKAFGNLPDNVILLAREPILDVVRSSDVVVLFRSTVGVLCLISETPLLIWDTTGEVDFMPYAASGAAPSVRRNEDLLGELEVLMSSDARKTSHPLFETKLGVSRNIATWLAEKVI